MNSTKHSKKPVHIVPTINDTLFKLTNTHYITLIEASSDYHIIKLDKNILLLSMFAYQFGRYTFTRLPFEVVTAGDMFQQKIDEIFKGLPNVFDVADETLTVRYDADGRDHDKS